jgi:dihydroxyacetone kinase
MNQLKELVSKVTQEAVVSPQAKALDVFARRTEMAKMMATSNSTGTAVVNNMGGTSMSSSNVTNNNVTNVMPADDSSFKMASLNQNKYNFIG